MGEYIRGTRSRAPYGYSREGTPNAGPAAGPLAWLLIIVFLSAMAIFSWLFPAYVFRNPHIPFNYSLLQQLGKLEELKAFTATDPPAGSRGKFYTASELYNDESGRPDDQLAVLNDLQKRLYIQNYADGENRGYIMGDFEVVRTRLLGSDDFFPGLALEARSKQFPNVILEYLIPMDAAFENPYKPGDTLKLFKAGDLATILHLAHLTQDRLCVTAVSLTYVDRSDLPVAPPKALNVSAKWPVFAAAE